MWLTPWSRSARITISAPLISVVAATSFSPVVSLSIGTSRQLRGQQSKRGVAAPLSKRRHPGKPGLTRPGERPTNKYECEVHRPSTLVATANLGFLEIAVKQFQCTCSSIVGRILPDCCAGSQFQ